MNKNCKNCGNLLNKRQKMFCCRKCKAEYEKTIGKKEIVDKINSTFKKKYGMTPIERKNEVLLEAHGTIHALQIESSNRKMKNTMKDRYGCEQALKNKKLLDKKNKTCEQIYGSQNVFNNEDVRKKAKETIFKKYGTEYVSQNDDIKRKVKNTMFDRYGVECAFELPNAKSQRISKLQQTIFESVKNIHSDALLEHRLNDIGRSVDIYIPSKNIVIEVNGDYYHMNPSKYSPNDFNKRYKMTAKEIWEREKNRLHLISEHLSCSVIVIWESDWKNDKNIMNYL
jgi:hypothetical protein